MGVVVRQAQPLQVAEQPHPQVAQEPLAQRADGGDLPSGQHVVHDGHAGVGGDGAPQHGFPPREHAMVDGDAHDERPGQLRQHVADDGQRGHRGLAAVGPQHACRAAHHLAGGGGVEAVLLGHTSGQPHQAASSTAAARTSP
jgi:hypothetical protein